MLRKYPNIEMYTIFIPCDVNFEKKGEPPICGKRVYLIRCYNICLSKYNAITIRFMFCFTLVGHFVILF